MELSLHVKIGRKDFNEMLPLILAVYNLDETRNRQALLEFHKPVVFMNCFIILTLSRQLECINQNYDIMTLLL